MNLCTTDNNCGVQFVGNSEKSLNGPGIGAVETDETAQQREVLQWLLTLEKKEGEPSLDGGGMLQNLQANFPDYHVVDLTGIGLDDALSMISEGSPLIVKNSEGKSIPIYRLGSTIFEDIYLIN